MLTFTQQLCDEKAVVYGTALFWQDHGLLLIGPSGSGKSELALRLMEKGADLIADDQVGLTFSQDTVHMWCPYPLQNKIEAFGMGILGCRTLPSPTPLSLMCVMEPMCPSRAPSSHSYVISSHSIPYLTVNPFWPSTPYKLKLLLESGAFSLKKSP